MSRTCTSGEHEECPGNLGIMRAMCGCPCHEVAAPEVSDEDVAAALTPRGLAPKNPDGEWEHDFTGRAVMLAYRAGWSDRGEQR